MSETTYLQRNQPPDVPPLQLTGERTLPDIPEENYWFQRHLAVYQWAARQLAGKRVIDMASGEGYGAAVLAERARSVVGVEANPEAYEHARLRYRQPNLRFARALIETFAEPCDAVVCLQTVEHLAQSEQLLAHFAQLLSADADDGAGVLYLSTPNVLTLAPAGAQRSDNPWHVHEYTPTEFRSLCEQSFSQVQILGLFHARRLRLHALALRCGWDRVHRRLGMTERFYGRFVPAIDSRDFVLRPERLERALDLVAICRR